MTSKLSAARHLAALGFIVLLCALAVEAAGTFWFWWETGRLVYLNVQPQAQAAPPAGCKFRIHPYFGFTFPYDSRCEILAHTFQTSNLGFLQRSAVHVPFRPADKDFVVAIFGGSVAAGVATSPPLLRELLQSGPALADRNVIVVNMAQGAGKQPQQLIEMSYLLALGQHLDVAVNIDGFNEFSLGYANILGGMDPSLPAAGIVDGLTFETSLDAASQNYYELAYRISSGRAAVRENTARADGATTGAGFLAHRVLLAWHQIALARSLAEYDAFMRGSKASDKRKSLSLDMPAGVSGAEGFETIFGLWLRSSKAMRTLAQASGITYVHIVQPNQYYSAKHFGEEEKRIALSLPADHPYSFGTRNGYRILTERSAELDAAGIVSAIGLFDREDEPTFIDNCCHYNARGDAIFNRFVADQVLRQLPGK